MKRIHGVLKSLLVCSLLVFLSCAKAPAIAVEEIPESIDMTQVQDGMWSGSWHGVSVKVTVKDKQMTKIELVSARWSSVGRKALYLIPDMLAAQSTQVDAISGATLSSRDLVKAVALALKQGSGL